VFRYVGYVHVSVYELT